MIDGDKSAPVLPISVTWNGNLIEMRRGAKVKHLLSTQELKWCNKGSAFVLDEDGNEMGLDGTLSNGMALYLKILK